MSAVVDLRGAGLSWRPLSLPDTQVPVAVAPLHRPPSTEAYVLAVRFPPGWRRDVDGHYDVDEELVVVDGDVQVGGKVYRAGDYGLLPAGTPRGVTVVGDRGCLAVAWFSGRPRWERHGPQCRLSEVVHCPVPAARRQPGGTGWAYGTRTPVQVMAGSSVDVTWPESAAWAWLDPGERPPAVGGPALVRVWYRPTQ